MFGWFVITRNRESGGIMTEGSPSIRKRYRIARINLKDISNIKPAAMAAYNQLKFGGVAIAILRRVSGIMINRSQWFRHMNGVQPRFHHLQHGRVFITVYGIKTI